ncbi:MAG: hypothetical protein NTY46_01355 [Candidatus Sumerlaeota bacterium]|nr:hypothetical protein [Candidatus Sumerlaeota bacterium]
MKTRFFAIALCAIVLVGTSAQAADWRVKATGNFSTSSTWELVSGSDPSGLGIPNSGDNIEVPASFKLWFDQSTTLTTVLIKGEACGSVYPMTAPINIVHKWVTFTLDGTTAVWPNGSLELVEGRTQGSVTYDVSGNMSMLGDAGFYCARFAAGTKEEQTIPNLKVGGDFTISSSRGFPIYPLNYGGTLYDMTNLEFTGTGASVLNVTVLTTVEFADVIVPNGKKATFRSAGEGIYIGKDLITDIGKNLLVKTGGEALIESPMFLWGVGGITTEANSTLGVSAVEGFASGWKQGLGTLPLTADPSTIAKYFGSLTQALGPLMVSPAYKLALDKSGGALNMEKDLTVHKLALTNGTINTGSFTLTGPDTLADLEQGAGQVVGNWVKPWLTVSEWSVY